MTRWRWWVVGYLVWLMLFAVVEGTGRQVCRVPTAKWLAGGADARERTARDWFRTQASACLDHTRWYGYATRALVVTALAGALATAWVARRRSHVARGLAFAGTVVLVLGSILGVRWMYDWLS